jgi:hypothetical protein
MDNCSTTTATLDQADEESLTYTVSDEALELAAAGGLVSPPNTVSDTVCVSCYNECKVIF